MKLKDTTVISSLILIISMINSSNCIKELNNHTTILDNLTWECANNASCINMIANNVLNRYRSHELIDFGLFSVKSLQPLSSHNNDNLHKNEGRSSAVMDFLNGNMLRIPIGPMVFSVQRSDDSNYLEVALLKRIHEENGRRHGGGGIGGRKEKKHVQMYIPMYLAATTFGWTLAAIKAVGVITIKALFVSKLALIIAGALIIKKLLESAAERMYVPHYPEQHHHEHPFMLPYNMEYAHLPHALTAGAEISPHELYSFHVGHPHDIPAGVENLAAESSLSHSVQIQNATQQQQNNAALNGVTYPKVKRDDHQAWSGIKGRPMNYVQSNNPFHVYRKF